MNEFVRLGVIGAGGWLGSAIVSSLLSKGVVRPLDLALSFRREQPKRFPDAFWSTDNQAVADRSDVILLSVRPADWPSVALEAKGKLVVSVMAGIGLAALSERHRTNRVVRALPNAAAEVGKSYTPWVAYAGVENEDRQIVRAVFDACGSQDEFGSERDIDYLTGLSGSGPAYPALLASAMMKNAVENGLQADVAQRAVNAVIVGAGRLLELANTNPNDTVESFVAYRGTTAAAIEAMRASGFESAISNGLKAALKKVGEL